MDLEFYIDPYGYIMIGGKEMVFGGDNRLHAYDLRSDALKYNTRLRQLMDREWIRLAQLWDEILPVVRQTIFNVTAAKEARRKEGYVTVNITVDAEPTPKARLRWGPERPPTHDEIVRDVVALHQLAEYDLRFPTIMDDIEGHFSLSVVVSNKKQADKVVNYFQGFLERNFPAVFKSLVVF